MRGRAWIAVLLVVPPAAGRAAAEELGCCPPAEPRWVKRVAPVGGWHPYWGGLLSWWDPHCFPRCGSVDDYHRKCPPPVCWPPYPAYFSPAAPEPCRPAGYGATSLPNPLPSPGSASKTPRRWWERGVGG